MKTTISILETMIQHPTNPAGAIYNRAQSRRTSDLAEGADIAQMLTAIDQLKTLDKGFLAEVLEEEKRFYATGTGLPR